LIALNVHEDHYKIPIPLPSNYKRKKYFKNCAQRYKQKERKQTSIQCQICQVPLYPFCLKDYHAAQSEGLLKLDKNIFFFYNLLKLIRLY